MINYDLTPAEWASGSVTMRFLVENYPKEVIPTFLRVDHVWPLRQLQKLKPLQM